MVEMPNRALDGEERGGGVHGKDLAELVFGGSVSGFRPRPRPRGAARRCKCCHSVASANAGATTAVERSSTVRGRRVTARAARTPAAENAAATQRAALN